MTGVAQQAIDDARLAAAVRHSADIIVLLDAGGTLLYASPAAGTVLGYPAASLVGRKALDLLPPKERSAVGEKIDEALARPAAPVLVRYRFRRPDGVWCWFESTLTNLLADPAVRGLVANMRDVTARVRAENDRHKTEQKLLALFTSDVVGIAWGEEYLVREANDHFLDMFGYERHDLPLDWNAMVPPQHAARVRVAVDEGKRTGHIPSLEVEARRKDGTLIPVIVGSTVITPAPYEYVCFVLDITERKTMEREGERLLAAEHHARDAAESAVQLRDEFLANAAHDLRSPITAIQGRAQLLRRRLGRGMSDIPKLTEGLEAIQTLTTRMVAQIDELQDMAYLQIGQPLELRRQAINLTDIVRANLAQFERHVTTHRFCLDLDGASDRVVVVADVTRIERVITNLLANAVKYSPRGSEIRTRVARDGTSAMLTIADDGVGIPASELPRIFKRFHRAKNVGAIPGTGIGLFGAKQIVELHGGTIAIESAEGTGTTVTIRLPLEPISGSEQSENEAAIR